MNDTTDTREVPHSALKIDAATLDKLEQLQARLLDPKATEEQNVEQLNALLGETALRIRFLAGNAVRGVLKQASNASISKSDITEVTQSSKILVDVMRNTAVLLDSLHELSTSHIVIADSVGEMVALSAQLIGACHNLRVLSGVSIPRIQDTIKQLDTIAEVVEKSEDVFSLLGKLEEVEIGVHNLGITKTDFEVLSGLVVPPKPPLDPRVRSQMPDPDVFRAVSAQVRARAHAGPAKTPEELDRWIKDRMEQLRNGEGEEGVATDIAAREPEPFDPDPTAG